MMKSRNEREKDMTDNPALHQVPADLPAARREIDAYCPRCGRTVRFRFSHHREESGRRVAIYYDYRFHEHVHVEEE
jgi:uncharacterized paraquat-inducible protein A